MKTPLCLTALLLVLAPASGTAATAALPENGSAGPEAAPALGVSTDKDWSAKKTDNICGLSDLGKVSSPAVLDYEKCLDATPEMKKIKDEGIDKGSAKGIQLKAAAATRVGNAAETYRKTIGYCSVWKSIKHKDGRRIPDITEKVIAQY